MSTDLPTLPDLLLAREWVMKGAPAVDPHARQAVNVLFRLIEAMPGHFPKFCYGTPEYRKALDEEGFTRFPRKRRAR